MPIFSPRAARFLCTAASLFALLSSARAAESRYRLEQAAQPGEITRVNSILEISGQLKVNADGKQLIRVPVSGKGELQYTQRLLTANQEGTPEKAIRVYHATSANSRIGDKSVSSQLNNDRQLIVAQASSADVVLFSPLGPLSRDELELIDIQGNTLLLGRLLPSKEVAVGDKWSHDDALVAALLKLDLITENKLESVLKRVADGTAFIEMSGTVEASVGGVTSQLEVTAKYNFELKPRQITWLAMSIKEDRSVGHAEPGLDVTARLRISIAKGEPVPELSDAAIAQLPQEATSATTLIAFTSGAGGIRFVHDRNWRVMIDRSDVIILRLVERGDLIAQCNISRLADAQAGKQLTMMSFQSDIRRVLDANFGQFTDTSESPGEHGLRMLRTVVAGVAADLPIQWTYYHLTGANGQQASLVFTLDAKLVERFSGADQALVSSFEFVGPGPAVATSASAKTAASPADKQR
jgi:hypothetical protein